MLAVRDGRLLHALGVGHRHVGPGDALDGGVVWTPRGPVSLDLLRGYPDEVAAKIVTVAGTVTGQQFNQIAQGRLTELVTELDAAGQARTFAGLQAGRPGFDDGVQP